ncbi:AMP-binding protein [Propionibacteriaceae bacterium G1746]|uniref:AMP-binding protein n=1 Tax=Aestuariimicrobium sp. G57 TaxID=3418485 RepID=UPI003C1B484A
MQSVLTGEAGVLATSLVADDRPVTHGELAGLVAERAASLPDSLDGRCLVHLHLERTLDAVVSYLAVLEAGHVALVLPPTGAEQVAAAYPADFTHEPGGFRRDGYDGRPQHLLHPSLAVLLSTSGSTGSPKLVRLSHENLRANAQGIVAALGITAADRGITSLPLHYCYGLSVLHAHLLAGASVVLHDGSSVHDQFWQVVRDHDVTNVALVPHSAQWLLDHDGLADEFPRLRLLTQAGGRLPARSVRQLADVAARQGCELRVMYGQTESTARICIAPAGAATTSSDSVGRAIPGTTLRLDKGELVVRGPSVMLGYAEHPDDLALGRMLRELHTGDLATIDESGMVRIVGRRRNFVKIMGLRIDLNRVEAALGEAGYEAVVTGDDEGLRVLVAPPAQAARVRRTAATASGVGPGVIDVIVADLPLLSNGKVDRSAADVLVRAGTRDDCRDTRRTVDGTGLSVTVTAVADVLAQVLAVEALDPDRSFVEQGGDSLTHVPAAARLSALVGQLPPNWHHLPIKQLAGTSPATGSRVETSVVLRALAVLAICFSHTRVVDLPGGAHVLLAIAGWNAARFGLSLPDAARRIRSVAASIFGIWVPTAAAALLGILVTGRYGWENFFMANWLFGGLADTRVELWFVDSLVACLVVLTALCCVPAVARARAADPWRVHLVIAAVALVPRFVVHALSDAPIGGVPYTVFFIFAAGAALAHAQTTRQRLMTLAVLAIGIATYFPDPQRNLSILLGVCLLAFVPDLRVPRWLVSAIVVLASASLYIYVFQFQAFQLVPRWQPGPIPGALRSLTALAVGGVLWWLADPWVRRLRSRLTKD